jgi:hypothetical protein
VNTDAAFDAESGTGSGGVTIRDEQGLVIAGAAHWFDPGTHYQGDGGKGGS